MWGCVVAVLVLVVVVDAIPVGTEQPGDRWNSLNWIVPL
jgi:hypothetical protein